ncbi:MAG: SDR family NAD(P)-dependent oxidoreductase, partial [Methylocapsa sp.]|nr:SDR family NAD(P)-dependent oxidoreductase [Methylocapsa sp.]
FADLQFVQHYNGLKAYSRSKLCNILFTRELARRLEGTGVTANCLHPGFVATRFGGEAGGPVSLFLPLAKLFAISPARGAETLVYLASAASAEGLSGKYFYECRPVPPSPEAQDDRAALMLWERSAKIAGIGPEGGSA